MEKYYLVYVIRDFKPNEYKFEKQLVGCYYNLYKALVFISKCHEKFKNNIYYLKESYK